MSNDSFKDSLLKLGKSSRHPESFRRKELETTGVPGKFRVEYVAFTDEYDNYEKKIHKHFEKERYAENREFFSVDLRQCLLRIRLLLGDDIIFEEINFDFETQDRETITEYFENGNDKCSKKVKENKLWGGYKEYYESGSLKLRTNFVRNVENGLRKEYKKNGELRARGYMYEGKKQGEWITHHKLGEEKRYYDNGKPIGKWSVFSKSGRLLINDYGELPDDFEDKKYQG